MTTKTTEPLETLTLRVPRELIERIDQAASNDLGQLCISCADAL
jgi:hypothetical protein